MIYVSLFRLFVIVFMHINFMCELTLISRNGMNKVFCSLYYVSGLFLPASQDTLPKVCSHTGNRVGEKNQK